MVVIEIRIHICQVVLLTLDPGCLATCRNEAHSTINHILLSLLGVCHTSALLVLVASCCGLGGSLVGLLTDRFG